MSLDRDKGSKCQPVSSWTAERPCVLAESAVIKDWVRAKGSNHPLITAWHSARCPATEVVKWSQTMMLPLPCFPAGLRIWYESLTWSSTSSINQCYFPHCSNSGSSKAETFLINPQPTSLHSQEINISVRQILPEAAAAHTSLSQKWCWRSI